MSDPQDSAPTPVIIPATATSDQIFSIVRQFAVGLAGYLVGKGVLDGELVGIILPAALGLGAIIWSQVSIARKQARAVTMANHLDDSIAQVR